MILMTAVVPASAQATDADVIALMQKHCVMCHGREPTHPAFAKPPKNIVLESIAAVKANAAKIREQVVIERAMPLGNESAMTDAERDVLARWIGALK